MMSQNAWLSNEKVIRPSRSVSGLMDLTALSGSLPGDTQIGLSEQGRTHHETVIDALCYVFGNDIRSKVKSDRQSAWRGNPFVRVPIQPAMPGQFHQRAVLAKPWQTGCFFAARQHRRIISVPVMARA